MERYKPKFSGWKQLWILPLILFMFACITPERREVSINMTTFSFDRGQHPFEVFSDYVMAPGDLLDVLFQIRTWVKKDEFLLAVDHKITIKFLHASELDSSQQIRPDGTITLPYIGSVNVVDMTVENLTRKLQEKYKSILNVPEILVEVPDFRSSIRELKADLHTAPRGLSRLVTVRPDGYVTFPMVGDLLAAGRTIPELNDLLNQQYETILPGLHCDLFLEKHSGSLVYVVGEVRNPGGYEIRRPVTLPEAVSMASGWLPGAQLNSVFVIRRHENKLVAVRLDLKKMLAFQPGSEMFFLKPRDIVYVPKTWLKKAAEVARNLAEIVFFRGWALTGQLYIDEEGGISILGPGNRIRE